jgi:hypothetical protein
MIRTLVRILEKKIMTCNVWFFFLLWGYNVCLCGVLWVLDRFKHTAMDAKAYVHIF